MRSELRNWFRKYAESLAPAYEGAVELLGDVDFPGRTHFIAHAVRDITDRLVFALDPQRKGQRVQYEQDLDEIQEHWQSPDRICQDAPSSSVIDGFTIPMDVARRIDLLIVAHRDRRRRPSQYELLFRFLMRNDPLAAALNGRTIKAFKKTSKWFVERAHFPAKPLIPVEEQEFQRKFAAFEIAIYGFVGSFFRGTSDLDEILQQANR